MTRNVRQLICTVSLVSIRIMRLATGVFRRFTHEVLDGLDVDARSTSICLDVRRVDALTHDTGNGFGYFGWLCWMASKILRPAILLHHHYFLPLRMPLRLPRPAIAWFPAIAWESSCHGVSLGRLLSTSALNVKPTPVSTTPCEGQPIPNLAVSKHYYVTTPIFYVNAGVHKILRHRLVTYSSASCSAAHWTPSLDAASGRLREVQ